MEAASTSLVVDASNTLDSIRLSGVQRLALRVMEELSLRADVDLTVLDGRSGQLRALRPRQRERLLCHFDRDHQAISAKVRRRVARNLPIGTRWRPEPDQWLVDLEPSWHAVQPRALLLPSITCRSAALIHDLLPLRHPEWFPPTSVSRFAAWFDAHVSIGSRLLANSAATAADVADWLNLDSPPPVLRLGVDPVDAHPVPEQGLILMIGTIEPRKGHELLLDALDLMTHPPVVDIVGSAGWIEDELLARLEGHPLVRWHRDLADPQLDDLMQRASLLIQPSLAEGFGLPVAEALARHIPVLASDLPVFAESSQGAAQRIAPTPQDWARELARFSEDPAFRASLRDSAASFEPFRWAQTAEDLLVALSSSGRDPTG